MRLARNIKIYLSHKYTGERLDDIGGYFGIGDSGVCKAGRRIAVQIEKDQILAKTVKKIEGNLSRRGHPPSLKLRRTGRTEEGGQQKF